MTPSASRRQSLTPYVPGAWPTCSYHEDTTQDADVSSISSYSGSVTNLNPRSRKARRRWTYTGPVRPYVASGRPPGLTHSNLAALNPTSDPKLSPVTVSTALSSPLNTPDLADWPTQLDLNPGRSTTDRGSAALYTPSNSDFGLSVCSSNLASSAREHQFPSPHLDPPLLNFIPSLPSLKHPAYDSLRPVFPPETPSPRSQVCLTPASLSIPPTGWESTPSIPQSPNTPAAFFPVVEVTRSSSLLSTCSASRPSEADSPVLPAGKELNPNDSHGLVSAHLSIPSSEMDAFALAAAVALSPSRSSFSIPPSTQSGSPSPTPQSNEIHRPDTYAHAHPLEMVETSASQIQPHQDELVEDGAVVASGKTERVLSRHLSAPQPTVHQTPRPRPAPTISSRVAVGDNSGRKVTKRPVIGKVRRLGERLRGLFKGRAEATTKTRDILEYGLMTTTTAITNIEYESHPIPSPSPRAKKLRNHRRSLPLPALLPRGVDRAQPSNSRRIDKHDDMQTPTQSNTVGGHQQSLPGNPVCPQSPRTPRARQDRSQPFIQPDSGTSKKARRFSLSSALSKSKMDSLRTTMMPRPPLPSLAPRENSTAQTSAPDVREVSPPGKSSSSLGQDRFWGGELPNIGSVCNSPGAGSMEPASPVRSRTRTAPAQALCTPDIDSSIVKDKRSRRFSLSSIMAKRSTRQLTAAGHISGRSSPTSLSKATRPRRRRPRDDNAVSVTHANVQFDMVSPRLELDINPPRLDAGITHRSSHVPSVSSSTGESTYYDAKEETSEDEQCMRLRQLHSSSSSKSESDLDSMSFARTPDHSSGTLSFGSSTEREYHHQNRELSTGSFTPYRYRRPSGPGYTAANVAHLVGETTSTPVTKTLRLSPSLSLSFDLSCSDVEGDGDEDLRRMDQEEELSFMRALGFEFDQIARRVREEPF